MSRKTIRLYSGVSPYPWQRVTHDHITRILEEEVREQHIITIKAARQIYGKSTFTKAELLRFSLGMGDRINGYISPTLKLAKKMYKEIVKTCYGLIVEKSSTDLFIEFNTGSSIHFFSAEQRANLRGFTITGVLVIDEAAFIPDHVYFELLSPWVRVHKALTILMSTPKYKTGFFYELYKTGLEGETKGVATFDWVRDYRVEFDEFTLGLKKTIPLLKWKSEYIGLFLDAESSVFGNMSGALINKPPLYKKLYCGLDFGTGSGKDYTVLTAFNEEGEMVFIWAVNDLSPVEQVDQIVSILSGLRPCIKGIYVEQNSIGKIYLDMLKKKLQTDLWRVLKPFNTDNESKRKLVEELQVAFEQGTVKVLNDQELLTQLSVYEMTFSKTGKQVYNAQAGYHDDYVIATLLALWCLRQNMNKKRYNVA